MSRRDVGAEKIITTLKIQARPGGWSKNLGGQVVIEGQVKKKVLIISGPKEYNLSKKFC